MDAGALPLGPEHLAGIMRIQALAYSMEYIETEPAFMWKLRDGAQQSLGFFEDDLLVAYAVAFPWTSGRPVVFDEVAQSPADPDALYVHDIAVDPAVAGRRLGRVLMETIIDRAWASGWRRLEIVGVQGGEHYWGQLGFVIDGPAGDDYGPGAVKMSLNRPF